MKSKISSHSQRPTGRPDASSLPSPLLRQAGRLRRCMLDTSVFWRVQDF